jgi:hypothetical protein
MTGKMVSVLAKAMERKTNVFLMTGKMVSVLARAMERTMNLSIIFS